MATPRRMAVIGAPLNYPGKKGLEHRIDRCALCDKRVIVSKSSDERMEAVPEVEWSIFCGGCAHLLQTEEIDPGKADSFRELQGRMGDEGVLLGLALMDEKYGDDEVPEGLRECDRCGRRTDAGAFPDWVDGVCEVCDPDIWDHPDNVERMKEPE